MWRTNGMREADYTDVLELDLATVEPSLAGPKRPQDRVPLRTSKATYRKQPRQDGRGAHAQEPGRHRQGQRHVGRARRFELADGAVLIAAITSCTNTSNPAVLIARRPARAQRAPARPRLASPGSRPASRRARASSPTTCTKAGLLADLEAIGFYLVGYGCTTCIGNSGPLRPEISERVRAGDIVGVSVLSGNRNFEGRVHPEVKMNFLASPPLVVAYALAGHDGHRPERRAARHGQRRQAGLPQGHLADARRKSSRRSRAASTRRCSARATRASSRATSTGTRSQCRRARSIAGSRRSTYVRNPPYFEGMTHDAGRRSRTSAVRACWHCSATR